MQSEKGAKHDRRCQDIDIPRCIAGIGASVGACLLIWKGNVTEGTYILGIMVAFFAGEANGARKAGETPS